MCARIVITFCMEKVFDAKCNQTEFCMQKNLFDAFDWTNELPAVKMTAAWYESQ